MGYKLTYKNALGKAYFPCASIIGNMRAFTLAALLLLPSFTFGADPGGLVTCTGPDCNLCTLVEMINAIVAWLFGFLTLAAVAILVFAGFKLIFSAGDTSARSDAVKMLTNVVVGFVIVLAAWLIVDTMMKGLMDPNYESGELEFGPWNKIPAGQCGGAVKPKTTEVMYCFEGSTIDGAVPGLSLCEQKRQEAIAAGHTGLSACHVCDLD
jgi:hypothetical protein